MKSPQDDDLQNCLSNQPRRTPKPKRAVTSLTFSPQKWREANRWYNRSLPPLRQWPRWIWAMGAVGGLLAVLQLDFGVSVWTPSRGGEISSENLTNFPPPSPYREVATDGRSPIVITNGSPEPMRIGLKGAEQDYAFDVGPCRDCTYTDDDALAERFCDRGPQEVLYVPPGDYEVTVGFGGTIRYFRSGWSIADGWEYRQCIYGGTNLR